MNHRRDFLSGSARVAGMLAALCAMPSLARAEGPWNAAAFDAKTIADMTKALGIGTPVESKDIQLVAPDIAENGAVVPVTLSTTLPGVKKMMVLVEKNPSMLTAMFDVTDAVEPNFKTRVKMGQSSNIVAVALMADGRVLYASKETKVTLGGCGG